jgi:hypothetical protein
MQINPTKKLRLTQFVASLTKIDSNPPPPPSFLATDLSRRSGAKTEAQRRRTLHVCSTGNHLGGIITHLNAHVTEIKRSVTDFITHGIQRLTHCNGH